MGSTPSFSINPLEPQKITNDQSIFQKMFKINPVIRIFNDSLIEKKTYKPRPPIIPYRKINKVDQLELKKIVAEDQYDKLQAKINTKQNLLFLQLFGVNTFFTLVHLVVQSDKPIALQTILKKVYSISQDHYLKYINLQTYQGYTPLVIGILNNANQSIELLFNYGGIQIDLVDQSGKTALDHAKISKNAATKSLVEKYSKLKIKQVNTKLLKDNSDKPLIQLTKKNTSNLGKLTINPSVEIPDQILKKFPNDIAQILLHYPEFNQFIKTKRFYFDPTFPAENKVLSHLNIKNNFLESIIWLRPIQIFGDANYQLFGNITSKDIRQGQLKSCYYLSILASLAQNPNRIKKIFKNGINIYGIYVIQFYIDGMPKQIIIDDQFPCISTKSQLLFAKPNKRQIWGLILEKAWIKQFKYYSKAQSVPPDLIIQDIIGVPSYGYWIKNYQNDILFEMILDFYSKKYVLVTVSKQLETEGIVPGYSYSILDVRKIKNLKLIKVRNPMGHFEWNGTYGDNSSLWTPQLLSELKQIKQDDGQFWVTSKQFGQLFQYLAVGYYIQNYFYNFVKIKSNPFENMYFKFELKKTSYASIRFIQKFNKYVPDQSYQYSQVRFNLIKIINQKSTQHPQFISHGCDRTQLGHKNIHISTSIFTNLNPGTYYINLMVKWISNKYKNGVIAVYSDEQIKIHQISNEIGQPILKQAYFNEIIRQSNGWTKSGSYLRKQKMIKSTKIIGVRNVNEEVDIKFSDLENCFIDLGKVNDKMMKIKNNSVGILQKNKNNKGMKYKF